MNESLTIRRPDDWHVHLRDGAMLRAVVTLTARQVARAIVMPNLAPPVTRAADAAAYRERILAALPEGSRFTPLMTAYLTDATDPDDLASGFADGVLTASGSGPDGHETYRLPLPAVATILEGGVEPRYPTVPGRMKAKKAPVEEREPTTAPVGPSRLRLVLPPPTPSSVEILGEGPAAASAVVDLFEQLGVLSR